MCDMMLGAKYPSSVRWIWLASWMCQQAPRAGLNALAIYFITFLLHRQISSSRHQTPFCVGITPLGICAECLGSDIIPFYMTRLTFSDFHHGLKRVSPLYGGS